MVPNSPMIVLLAAAPLIGIAIAFILLLVPLRRIARQAGFALSWAWFAATLLVSGELIRFGLAVWSVGNPAGRTLLMSVNPWLSYLFLVEVFGLLWLFAFVRWPARLAASEGTPAP